ncbi:MAG: hypothetical protein ABID87_07900 [Chloroflexota bacterium]
MIEITEPAKQELKKLLEANVDWPGACLRIIDRGGGKLGLGVDIRSPGDEVVEHEGSVLVIVDAGLAGRLKKVTLDTEDTGRGTSLVIIQET